MAIPAEIFCDNDLPIAVGPISLKSFTTGVTSLGTGLTVKAMISASNALPSTPAQGGTPINAALTITLTEEAGGTANYFGGWQGADLTAHLLPTYKDTIVYIIVWSGQDFRVVGQTTVRDIRPLDEAA